MRLVQPDSAMRDQPDVPRFVVEYSFPLMTRKADAVPQTPGKSGRKKQPGWILADKCFEKDEKLCRAEIIKRAKKNCGGMGSGNTVDKYLASGVECGALKHDKSSGEYWVDSEQLNICKNPVELEIGSAESTRIPYKN